MVFSHKSPCPDILHVLLNHHFLYAAGSVLESVVADKAHFVGIALILDRLGQDKGVVGTRSAEQIDRFVGHSDVFFGLFVERGAYGGELTVKWISLICGKFVFTHVDAYLSHVLYWPLVFIERGFILGLINSVGGNHLVAKERDGVQVIAKSECPNADRVYLIGDSYILQFLTIVEGIVADNGYRRRQQRELIVGFARWENH